MQSVQSATLCPLAPFPPAAMVDFCNPGVLGGAAAFRRYFEGPILAGREPGASEVEAAAGAARAAELSSLVNHFILRRTNTLLSAHLPPKTVEVVCCRMTPLQTALYNHFLASKTTAQLLNGQRASRVLGAITSLRKLLSHPKLVYDAIHSPGAKGDAEGFAGAAEFFPPGLLDDGRPGRGSLPIGWEHLSGELGAEGGKDYRVCCRHGRSDLVRTSRVCHCDLPPDSPCRQPALHPSICQANSWCSPTCWMCSGD